MTAFRRHAAWYTKGFRMTSELRAELMRIETLAQLADLFRDADRSQPFPPSAMRVPRGKTSGTQKVSLPLGYLNQSDDAPPPSEEDEDFADGG
jgi:hypothetical protein